MPKKAPQVNQKTPDESALFNFDFTEDLATGESIQGTPAVTASPSGLTIGTPSVSGAIVQVRLSSGATRTRYEVRCRVATDQSNTFEGAGDLLVNSLGR
jgi:hypothetical protein